MPTITNSPSEVTILEVEARKSLSFGVWVRDSNDKPVDLTGMTLQFTAGTLAYDGTPPVLANVPGQLILATQGYARFSLQASDLDLKPGNYLFTAVLVAEGFSSVLLKGEMKLLQNTSLDDSNTYAAANPPQAMTVHLLEQAGIHLDLSTLLPPDVLHVPPGGTTGQALIKLSSTSYDLAWATLSGGLSGAGQP